MVRGKTVVAEKPRVTALFTNEIDGHIGTPSGLIEFRRNAMLDVGSLWAAIEFVPTGALGGEPLGVGVFRPVRLWVMGPMKHAITVIDPFFHHAVGTGCQMKFAGQSAGVPVISQQPANQTFFRRHGLTILTAAGRAGISTSEKGGSAGGTDWALAISLGKGRAAGRHAVDVGSMNMRVAEGVNGVCPLLVGANPKNIRHVGHAR